MESLLKKSFKENLQIEFLVISDNPESEGLKKAEKLNVRSVVIKNLKKVGNRKEGEEELLKITKKFFTLTLFFLLDL